MASNFFTTLPLLEKIIFPSIHEIKSKCSIPSIISVKPGALPVLIINLCPSFFSLSISFKSLTSTLIDPDLKTVPSKSKNIRYFFFASFKIVPLIEILFYLSTS